MQTHDTPDLDSIRKAADRIRGHAHLTPILTSSAIDELLGCSLFFKCENLQKIGAFKFRGALNAVMSLDDDTAKAGIVTHSSGNHGAAIALAARIRGIDAHVVMPASANAAKKRAVAAYGATIVEWKCPEVARKNFRNKVQFYLAVEAFYIFVILPNCDYPVPTIVEVKI